MLAIRRPRPSRYRIFASTMSQTTKPPQQDQKAQSVLSPEAAKQAEQALLTSMGRRRAAEELSLVMSASGLTAEAAEQTMEGSTGRPSPKKHAALHTARFLLDTGLRRDVEGLISLVSYPFYFDDRLCKDANALQEAWLGPLRKPGQQTLAKVPPYKLIYGVAMNIDEFKVLDPLGAKRIQGLELADEDFLIGKIIAIGMMAEAVNYFMRWNNGTIKVAGIWS